MGAVKQLPMLLRGIRKLEPTIDIYIKCEDFAAKDDSVTRTLVGDLSREEIPMAGIHIGRGIQPDDSLKVNFSIRAHSEMVSSGGYWDGYLHIDPLKFEKRKLVSQAEIDTMRSKYVLFSDQVILGGSLTTSECVLLARTAKKVIDRRPKTKVVIVPRENPDDAMEYMRPHIMTTGRSGVEKISDNFVVINESGVLDKLYALCDIAIIGNTYSTGSGGQNPLEPAFYGKQSVYGGNYKNNQYAYEGLVKTGLLKRVDNDGLENFLMCPLSEDEINVARGKASAFIDAMQGSADVYATVIQTALRKQIIPDELNSKATNFLRNGYEAWAERASL
jgi:hypothetical protein